MGAEYEEEDPPLPLSRIRHIKKRALKNKSLAVSFDEKDLRDYVTGFHKRKKKRRKEAEKQQGEVLRRKRIEQRKKRKLEKDRVLFGEAPPPSASNPEEMEEEEEEDEDEDGEPATQIAETAMYDNGDVKVTVTTSEICREVENVALERREAGVARSITKKPSMPVVKCKPIKKVARQKTRPKPQSKRDKRMGLKMQNSYVERSTSVAREKRELDSSSSDEGQPDRKRPALASVIVEALKMDSLQKLCSSLEPILRRVVSEEVERALTKLCPAKVIGRSSPERIDGLDGGNLQLRFRSKLPISLFTGAKVEGDQGTNIHVVLIDTTTGHIVSSGPHSMMKLDIVVLEGDFGNEDDNWTQEDFGSHVVKEREGKRPLLTGDLQVSLKEGVGTLGDLTFTDNSSWTRSRKFRLGVKVASDYCEGIYIREAKTDAFTVKDHRGELYKKHYPPALDDEVWRLEKIGKDGSFHKRLHKAGINTVEDFLRLIVRDSQRLRNILGSGMSNKMWDVLVDHAKTCVLSGKLYVYYSDNTRNVGVVFNNIYVLSGLIANGQYYSSESLSGNQKVYVDTLVKKAYENWMNVIEYDTKSLLGLTQDNSATSSQIGAPLDTQDYQSSFDDELALLPTLLAPAPLEQSCMSSGPIAQGYNDSMTTDFSLGSQNIHFDSRHYDGTAFTQQNLANALLQPHIPRGENMLAFGQHGSSFQNTGTPNPNTYRGVEDFVSEEEIRMRSHEMLENEDMQHLLRIFNMGGHGPSSFNSTEDTYPYSSGYLPNPPPNYTFGRDQSRSSGKAVVGWLKLKAALRWGIFVRKKAAERRAKLVELDDL